MFSLKHLLGVREKLPEGYFGAFERENEKDWQLCSGIVDIPRPRYVFEDNNFVYEQNEIGKCSCTIHGAIGSLSDLSGYRFTLKERKEIYEKAIELGLDPNVGWFVDAAIDLVRDWWNENKDLKVSTYKLRIGSTEEKEVTKLGYSITTGYLGNSEYNKDISDGTLDSLSFGATTYGHCLRKKEHEKIDYNKVVDNYPVSRPKSNIYKVLDSNELELKNNAVFFRNGYIFIIDEDQKQIKSKVNPWAVKSVDKANQKGKMTNWKNPQDLVTPQELEHVMKNLGAIQNIEGGLSRERLAVALDNLKLLD